jgi:hypothetical protein
MGRVDAHGGWHSETGWVNPMLPKIPPEGWLKMSRCQGLTPKIGNFEDR